MIRLSTKPLLAAMLLTATLLTPGLLSAQMGMELTLNRTTFMQYEPIFACVSLRNDSGRPLVFGNDPRLQGYILFEVTDSSGKIMPQRGDATMSVTGLILSPGEVKNMIVPVNQFYDLDRSGTYRMHAYVTHSMLPADYKTRDLRFYVHPGTVEWKRTVGVPDLENPGDVATFQERTYLIRSIIENATQKVFYLTIEDNDHVYAVLRIGTAIGREPFKTEIDMLGRLHVLMPISPKVFHYMAISSSGQVYLNEFYKTTNTIPTLFRDQSTGVVRLLGGDIARPGYDYEDPEEGLVRASTLLQFNDGERVRETPQAPEAGSLVDLGEDL